MDPAKRIAIVAPSAYLLGGVQTWLDYLVPQLELLGWNVSVLLVHGVNSDAHEYLKKHPFKRVQLVVNRSGSREGRVLALIKAIQSSKADVVLNVNIADTYDAVARIREKHQGELKIIMALHGLNAAFFDDIERYSSLLDGVIATNKLATEAAVKIAGLPGTHAHYAPCGVEVPDFPDLTMTENTLDLLYSGRFDAREKRVMDLPVILKALENNGVAYRLRLAGTGPDEVELRSALAEFGEKVEFLGVLDSDSMSSKFYRSGSIALIMSPSETGPIAAWEAMAHGAVVVTSRFVGIGLEGSLLDGKTCLTFPVGDAESAAIAISSLRDFVQRSILIENAYQLVKDRYSREASVLAWHGALLSINEQEKAVNRFLPAEKISSGRLDRYFGAAVAESIRQATGLRFEHKNPGDEWPHSYGSDGGSGFDQRLKNLDAMSYTKETT